MPKYRHRVTGIVEDVPESYARAIKALEPVSEDEKVSVPCIPCGPPDSAGVEEAEELRYEEPIEYDEGDSSSWQS